MITRYGGPKFWEFISEQFHEKLRTDPVLRVHFGRRSESEAAMINFSIFRAGFGEDRTYYEQAVKEAHRDKEITIEQINRFLGCLRTVLIEEGVEDEDVRLIISRISIFGEIIVNASSD